MGKADRAMAEKFREMGFKYTAEYVEKFGIDRWNPSFIYGINNNVERFYKACVEQNKPWDKVNYNG